MLFCVAKYINNNFKYKLLIYTRKQCNAKPVTKGNIHSTQKHVNFLKKITNLFI